MEMEEYSGQAAHIYSVMLSGSERTLLEDFIEENEHYKEELNSIITRLLEMGANYGCRRQFFKEHEGAAGDGVCALWSGRLRLYCLYFDKTAVFFGSGGYKPYEAKAYQQDPNLYSKAKQMRKIAKIINEAIKSKDIKINEDGTIELTKIIFSDETT